MEYRAWKKQNGAGESIRTSLLGYGCMRFPTTPEGAIDEPRAEALLNAARDAGVNYFDTAYPYHGGQSEPFVGRVIAKWPRESFYLATKMPLWQCGSLEEAQHIFEEQLRRLGVEYIDFYLLHSLHAARYDRAKEMGIVDWLWEQKKLGRIRSFGFSCHDNAAGLEHILRDQPWDFCQLQYNYLDTDDRAEEISGDRGYQLTEELNIPLIIMEPIKGGTLANLPPEAEAPLRALQPEASDASWALRWVGSHRNVHVILSGMSAEDQLTDNLATFARFEPLTAAETAAVEQTAAFLHSRIKIGCTGCRYCMPCPMGWTSRTTSASGTSWGCSASPRPSSTSGKPASPMPKRPATASAAASARRPAPSICPSAMRWPSCSRSWISCNLHQKSHRQKPVAFFSYSLHSIPILSSIARRSGVSLGSWVISHSRIRRSQSPRQKPVSSDL